MKNIDSFDEKLNNKIRAKAKKILFEKMKFEGTHLLLFSNDTSNDNSALVETVVDAMIKFSNLSKTEKLKK